MWWGSGEGGIRGGGLGMKGLMDGGGREGFRKVTY